MPDGFSFPSRTDVWLLFDENHAYNTAQKASEKVFVTPFALLKSGVSLDDATVELASLFEQTPRGYKAGTSPFRPVLISFPMSLIGDASRGLIALVFAGVIVMLALTCANIATLLFARSEARAKEIALRLALGASDVRIALLLVWESAIISLTGGILGLLVAQASLDLTAEEIELRATDFPAFFWSLQIDSQVLLFTAAFVFIITLISGLIPAWRFFNSNVNRLLKEGAAQTKPRGDSFFVQSVMLLTITLSCCLFSSAFALFEKSNRVMQADYGVQPASFTTLRVGVVESEYNRRNTSEFFASLLASLKVEENLQSTFGANPLPGQPALYRKIDIQRAGSSGADDMLYANSAELMPGAMQALGTPLLAGRQFDENDGFDDLPVAIVTRTFVENAGMDITQILGARVRFSTSGEKDKAPWLTVVGVSEHVIYGNPYGFRATYPTVFTPASQNPWRFMSIGIKDETDTQALIDIVERNIEQLGSHAVVIDAIPYKQLLAQNTLMLRFVSTLYLVFAILAVALSTGSFYGIVSEQVQSRAFELGVRQAIGATQNQVALLAMKNICTILLSGCMLGGALSYFAIEHLYQQMQIVSPINPLYLYICPLLLFCFVSFISYFAVKTVVSK